MRDKQFLAHLSVRLAILIVLIIIVLLERSGLLVGLEIP